MCVKTEFLNILSYFADSTVIHHMTGTTTSILQQIKSSQQLQRSSSNNEIWHRVVFPSMEYQWLQGIKYMYIEETILCGVKLPQALELIT